MGKKTGKRRARPRTTRRAKEREHEKLVKARERLEAVEAGSSAERPIEVDSAAQIDGAARALVCPRCALGLYIVFERGGVRGGRVCRAVDLECRQCGHRRTAHFAIGAAVN